jgi:hypothetical protein
VMSLVVSCVVVHRPSNAVQRRRAV